MSSDNENEKTDGCCCGNHENADRGCCCGHEERGEGCGCGEHVDKDCGCGCGDKPNQYAEANQEDVDLDAMGDIPLPPPTLVSFATNLAQQAMISMGIIPNPITKKATFMLNQATYLIDTIDLIIQKTEGNRTTEETDVLNKVVSELRMLYVAAADEKKRRNDEQKS